VMRSPLGPSLVLVVALYALYVVGVVAYFR
jgi:hypothetical protein